MTIAVRHFTASREFLAAAGDYLAAREAEHNLMLGLCSTIGAHPEVYPVVRFVVAFDGGRVAGAAMQTVPHNPILSEMDAAVVPAIVAAVSSDVPGVLGPSAIARAFAEQVCARTGRAYAIDMRQRVFRLERVIAPRHAGGAWRLADPGDRELVASWIAAFHAETMPGTPPRDDPHAIADRWLRRVGKTIYLWHDRGEIVSFAGAGGDTPNGTRIGPVYTPPAHRGRGYASNVVAAATQHQLDAGRRFCFLFTDLANPTSNKIYQALGYAAVTDVDLYRFG